MMRFVGGCEATRKSISISHARRRTSSNRPGARPECKSFSTCTICRLGGEPLRRTAEKHSPADGCVMSSAAVCQTLVQSGSWTAVPRAGFLRIRLSRTPLVYMEPAVKGRRLNQTHNRPDNPSHEKTGPWQGCFFFSNSGFSLAAHFVRIRTSPPTCRHPSTATIKWAAWRCCTLAFSVVQWCLAATYYRYLGFTKR